MRGKKSCLFRFMTHICTSCKKTFVFYYDSIVLGYLEIFQLTEFESEIGFSKFETTDPIRWVKIRKKCF